MPVFFFHLTESAEVIPDPEGIELPNLAAAQKEATKAAGELIAEAVKKGMRHHHGRFDVEDELGECVFTLEFGCTIQISATPVMQDRA